MAEAAGPDSRSMTKATTVYALEGRQSRQSGANGSSARHNGSAGLSSRGLYDNVEIVRK